MLLAGAAACYAAALLCCAGSWRSLLPERLGLRDSLARLRRRLAREHVPAGAARRRGSCRALCAGGPRRRPLSPPASRCTPSKRERRSRSGPRAPSCSD